MDFKISSQIWNTKNLSSSEKMVLLALDHSGDLDGFSWQGYAKLAEMTGISKESKYLTRNLNSLEEKGYILIWRQHGHKGGRGYTHIYWPIIGRTDDQILEIVMRRFVATEDEARAIISQSGPIYNELVKRNRVSAKILEQTQPRKGVPQYTYEDKKGVPEYPNSDEKVLPETPIGEAKDKKGVPGTPRPKEESLNPIESIPNVPNSSPNGEEADKPPPTENKSTKPKAIPAVQVFVEVSERHVLNKAQMKTIDEKVGRSPPALERWRETVKAWLLRGYKINNADGMLDWFENGIPQQNGAHYGQKRTQQPTQPNSNQFTVDDATIQRFAGKPT